MVRCSLPRPSRLYNSGKLQKTREKPKSWFNWLVATRVVFFKTTGFREDWALGVGF